MRTKTFSTCQHDDRAEATNQKCFVPPKYGFLFLASSLLFLTACHTCSKRDTTVTLRCKVPTVTALPETKESQEKGGLEIGVVPVRYQASVAKEVAINYTQPPFEIISIHPGQLHVEEKTKHTLRSMPDRLAFAVRVNNKLDRVFRGQGSVVQFNVGGKLIPFGEINYAEFIGGIVPPRNETTLRIFGPHIETIPDKGTIGVFLYDVVTKTDVAGRVLEKQNYEWYFNYSVQEEQRQAADVTSCMWIDPSEYQRRKTEEAQQQIKEEQQKALERARQMIPNFPTP